MYRQIDMPIHMEMAEALLGSRLLLNRDSRRLT